MHSFILVHELLEYPQSFFLFLVLDFDLLVLSGLLDLVPSHDSFLHVSLLLSLRVTSTALVVDRSAGLLEGITHIEVIHFALQGLNTFVS